MIARIIIYDFQLKNAPKIVIPRVNSGLVWVMERAYFQSSPGYEFGLIFNYRGFS